MSGYLKIDRKIQDWKYISEPLAFALWVHLLMIAGWDDNGDFKKGELITSVSSLSEETGISRPIIRKWLKAFKDEEQIQVETIGKRIRVVILNYERYNWQKITTSEDDNWQKITSKVVKNDQITGKKLPDNWQKITTSEESHPYLSKEVKRSKRNKRERVERSLTLFDTFRSSYPKRSSAEKTKEAYIKALDSGATEEMILNSLEQWKTLQWDRWPEDERQYIPGVIKWLEEEKWHEEVMPYYQKKPKQEKKKKGLF